MSKNKKEFKISDVIKAIKDFKYSDIEISMDIRSVLDERQINDEEILNRLYSALDNIFYASHHPYSYYDTEAMAYDILSMIVNEDGTISKHFEDQWRMIFDLGLGNYIDDFYNYD